VIARLDGLGSPLLLSAHLDVVSPCRGVRPSREGDWIVSDGTTVLGADAKAAVAVLLEIGRVLGGRARDARPALELLFTWGEEQGHRGAKALDTSSLRSRLGLVLDALEPVGTIVHHAPTYEAVSVSVRTRGGHAGVDAGRGSSAIAIAARAIAAFPWGQLDESTTANAGTLVGGTARNAIAAEVILEAELRGLDDERLGMWREKLRGAFAVVETDGTESKVEFGRLYAGYKLAPDSAIVDLARQAFASIGGTAQLVHTFGGSDANELNALGIESCVLGIGAERCHSTSERIAVSQLVRLAEWTSAIVDRWLLISARGARGTP